MPIPRGPELPAIPALGHLPPAAPRPAQTSLFYTQIGATLSQVNRSSLTTGLATITERIPLVTSPYPIGYELNGLSDTGDWYQIVVADNWPGCNAGFEEVTEVWNNLQQSGPVNCDPTLSLSSGDVVELSLTVKSSSQACLGLADLTTKQSHQTCQSQPDSGGTKFTFLSTAADQNGYYTGTMTEVVNTTATSCPRYTLMPTVTFDFPKWADITEYVGWSDERDLGGSGTLCYDSTTGLVNLGPGDPTSHYADSTGGSQYGPHYIEGQNYSMVNATYGFRFQTDVARLSTPSIWASSLTPGLGQAVSLKANGSGGVPPYGAAFWSLNGTLRALGGLWWNWTANGSGNYTVTAYVVDRAGDVSPSAPSIMLRVPFHVWVGPIQTGGRTAADVNQTVVFSARAGGGTDWLRYSWTGLPVGCATSNRSALPCVPTVAGTVTVRVTVQDALGDTQTSPGFGLTISWDPVVTVAGDRAVADVGQNVTFVASVSNGSGGYRLAWSSLLPGCASSSLTATCAVTVPGLYSVRATVTDSNGYAQRSAPFSFTAFPAIGVSVSSGAPIVDVGVNLSLSAFTTGGAGNVSYSWSGLPAGCSSSNASQIRCAPTGAGTALVGVSVSDRAGGSAFSGQYTVLVAPSLQLTLTASASTVTAPGSVSFTLAISGGSLLRSQTWHGVPSGCAVPAPTSTCSGLAAGTYDISVTVTDVGGGSATAQSHVVVLPATAPPPPTNGSAPPLLTSDEIALIAVGLVVVAAIAVVALSARRRRK